MERINQKVKVFLQHYINYLQDNWIEWLLTVKFQHNNKKHSAMGYMPLKLNFERHPWKEVLTIEIELPNLETFLEKLQKS